LASTKLGDGGEVEREAEEEEDEGEEYLLMVLEGEEERK